MRRIVLALALTLSLATPAFAWNRFGHMLMAATAYEQLTPAVRARVSHLLQLNPSYPGWIARRRASQREEIAFMLAAAWPDDIRSDPGYINDGDRPDGPDAARNIGYADKLQHRYWHFINLPFSPDDMPLRQPDAPNLLTQMLAFRRALATDSTSDDVKSYDLVWLIHLVGDAHQPLHTVSRFTRRLPDGDEGGNLVACKRPCRGNLHAYWDDLLGRSNNPLVAMRQTQDLPRANAALAAIDDPTKWVQDSFLLAKKVVYTPPVGNGAGPYRLDDDYHDAALSVARLQIAIAAARLAHLLNTTLGKGPAY